MLIIGLQQDILWENRRGNFDKVENLLAEASVPKGSLILLPEMFSSGFSMHVDRVKEGHPSEADAFMAALAEKHKSCVIGGLVFQDESGKGLNCLSVFDSDGNKIGSYQKNYCFSYSRETDHYLPGDDILLFDWQGFTVCPFICYDLRFPELFRRGVRAGANLFPVIANWPEIRIDHWDALLTARAIENQAMVAGVNRVGKDPRLTYPGHTQVIDHQGEVLAKKIEGEGCVVAEVSVESLQDWRGRFGALEDMKAEEE